MTGEEGELMLAVDDLDPLLVAQCRICHDEEDERCGAMESPCACSGSLKFAHRECIQRWCDEKGNTTCEICLQPFQPGYTAPLPPNKTRLADVAVTIRGSLEVDREAFRRQIRREAAVARDEYAECAAAAERNTYFCRFVALVLTILLLVRHLVAVLQGLGEPYAFAIFTLMILRAGGIVLPLYIIMRIVEGVRRRQLQHWHQEVDDSVFENEDGHSHHTIQIQTE